MPEKLAIGEYMEIMHKDVENLLKSQCFEEVFRNITEEFFVILDKHDNDNFG